MSLHDLYVRYRNNVKICTEYKFLSKVTLTDILLTIFTQNGSTHKYE